MTTFIIKVTSGCNLSCKYCYDNSRQVHSSTQRMSESVLNRVISQLIFHSPDKAEFIWHGGEPLLAGMDFFESIVELQRGYAQPNQKVLNRVQSNGLLIDENWLEFFKENGFKVGLSLDGPQEIHDQNRITLNGGGSFSLVKRAIDLLQKHDINFGVLAVLTKHGVDSAGAFYSFMKEMELYNFEFNDLIDGSSEIAITPDEFVSFATHLFDLWMEDNDPSLQIRFLENFLLGLLGEKPHLCTLAGTCTNFLTVDTDGNVYACDKLLQYKFGNILAEDLPGILSKPEYIDFYTSVNEHSQDCLNCEYFNCCHSGCTYDRLQRGHLSDRTIFCSAHKKLFKHVEKHLRQMVIDDTLDNSEPADFGL